MARRRPKEWELVQVCTQQVTYDLERDRWGAFRPTAYVFCPWCGEEIEPGQMVQRDHETPVELHGEDEPENWQFLHADPCHKEKTKQDIARIAKAKRQAGETGQRARRAKRDKPLIQGRGFETNRDGAWKAKINARTEPRT